MIFAEDSNNEQSEFDTIVGCIEDIVIGEKFQDLQVFFKYFTVNNIEANIGRLFDRSYQIEWNAFFQESLIGSNCEEFDENSEICKNNI